jgi:anti-sigma factor RsiW
MSDELDRAHQPEAMRGDHLTVAEVAAYVDLRVDPLGRRRIEAHLAGCDGCLDEVLAILALLRRGRGR